MKAGDEVDRLLRKINDDTLPVDEPLFVLRAHDALAADIVRRWAEAASKAGVLETKVEEALALAKQMDEWPDQRIPD